jgi:hypothetical protein
MHGNITSAIFNQAAEEFDVPVVNIAYDGVGEANSVVKTFIEAARHRTPPARGESDR